MPSLWNETIIRILVETKRSFRTIALAISASHLVSPLQQAYRLLCHPVVIGVKRWQKQMSHYGSEITLVANVIRSASVKFQGFKVPWSFQSFWCLCSLELLFACCLAVSFVLWNVLLLCLWGQQNRFIFTFHTTGFIVYFKQWNCL